MASPEEYGDTDSHETIRAQWQTLRMDPPSRFAPGSFFGITVFHQNYADTSPDRGRISCQRRSAHRSCGDSVAWPGAQHPCALPHTILDVDAPALAWSDDQCQSRRSIHGN